MTPIIFRDETFDTEIHLLAPSTAPEVEAYIQGVTGETYDPGDYRGIAFYCERKAIIALEEWTGSCADIATLSHECLHTAFHIFHGNDIQVSLPVEEMFVLLQESLLRRCLIALVDRLGVTTGTAGPVGHVGAIGNAGAPSAL